MVGRRGEREREAEAERDKESECKEREERGERYAGGVSIGPVLYVL